METYVTGDLLYAYLSNTTQHCNPTITSTSSDYWYNYCGYDVHPMINIKQEEIKQERKEKMRGLYLVIVVDPRKNGKVILKEDVIAVSDEDAKLKALTKVKLPEGLEFDDVDVTVMDYNGNFIRPKKETQKVKIAKDDED